MRISTGLPLFGTPVDPQGTENQSTNTIFSAASTNLVSHVVDVSEMAIVVKAYGLTDGQTITVWTVTNAAGGVVLTEPMVINGRTVQLAESSNTLVIDISGNYKFVLSGGLGTVSCVYHDSGMSLFSFGLRAYATIDANLEFIETDTVRPQVSGVEVREFVKLSADGGNLLQERTDGLYYGILPPPSFANQFVSSSTGSDDPNTNDGTQALPWKTIQYAVSNLPDGTTGVINLLAGDTFTTWVDGSGNPPGGDIISGYTYIQAQAQIGAQGLQIGNRQLLFFPYNDTPIDDIRAYNTAHGTGYNPYVTAETNFPTIKFPLFHLTDFGGAYLPADMAAGIAGSFSFSAIALQVGVTGTSNPTFVNGCIPSNGQVNFVGGKIELGSVPLLGSSNGAGTQTFAENHMLMSSRTTPTTAFNVAGIQLLTNTQPSYSGGALVVPALTYTDIGDNTETFLSDLALWINLVVYDASLRCYSSLTTNIEIT